MFGKGWLPSCMYKISVFWDSELWGFVCFWFVLYNQLLRIKDTNIIPKVDRKQSVFEELSDFGRVLDSYASNWVE